MTSRDRYCNRGEGRGWGGVQHELTGAIKAAVLGSPAVYRGVAGPRQAVVETCTAGTHLPVWENIGNYGWRVSELKSV